METSVHHCWFYDMQAEYFAFSGIMNYMSRVYLLYSAQNMAILSSFRTTAYNENWKICYKQLECKQQRHVKQV